MDYATLSDIENTYGARHLETLVPVDVDMAVAVGTALNAAKAEIDVYLRARYALPIAAVPQIIRTAAIDIACYRLAVSASALTDEIKDRARRAVDILKDISAGRAKLDELESDGGTGSTGTSAETSDMSSDGAAFSSRRRRWGGEGGGL